MDLQHVSTLLTFLAYLILRVLPVSMHKPKKVDVGGTRLWRCG